MRLGPSSPLKCKHNPRVLCPDFGTATDVHSFARAPLLLSRWFVLDNTTLHTRTSMLIRYLISPNIMTSRRSRSTLSPVTRSTLQRAVFTSAVTPKYDFRHLPNLSPDTSDPWHCRSSASPHQKTSPSSCNARTRARSHGPRCTAGCTRRVSLKRLPRSAPAVRSSTSEGWPVWTWPPSSRRGIRRNK